MTESIIKQCAAVGLPSGDVRWMLGLASDKPSRNQLFHCFASCFEARANGVNVPVDLLIYLYRKLLSI